jgi:cyclase
VLRKRVIFTLIYSDGYFMQSRNFRLQRVGDLRWLQENYHIETTARSIDELIVLNASRGEKQHQDFSHTIENLVEKVFIPIAVGGGIRSVGDAERFFAAGADKLVVNSVIEEAPSILESLISRFGGQSVIASIDYKKVGNVNKVLVKDGSVELEQDIYDYIKRVAKLGVGEIYLNSIDRDGTGFGYDKAFVGKVAAMVDVPIIAAGGAGNHKHFLEVLNGPLVSAAATANLLNFVGDGLEKARMELLKQGIDLPRW